MGVEDIMCTIYNSGLSSAERELIVSLIAALLFGILPLLVIVLISDEENMREENDGHSTADGNRSMSRTRQESMDGRNYPEGSSRSVLGTRQNSLNGRYNPEGSSRSKSGKGEDSMDAASNETLIINGAGKIINSSVRESQTAQSTGSPTYNSSPPSGSILRKSIGERGSVPGKSESIKRSSFEQSDRLTSIRTYSPAAPLDGISDGDTDDGSSITSGFNNNSPVVNNPVNSTSQEDRSREKKNEPLNYLDHSPSRTMNRGQRRASMPVTVETPYRGGRKLSPNSRLPRKKRSESNASKLHRVSPSPTTQTRITKNVSFSEPHELSNLPAGLDKGSDLPDSKPPTGHSPKFDSLSIRPSSGKMRCENSPSDMSENNYRHPSGNKLESTDEGAGEIGAEVFVGDNERASRHPSGHPGEHQEHSKSLASDHLHSHHQCQCIDNDTWGRTEEHQQKLHQQNDFTPRKEEHKIEEDERTEVLSCCSKSLSLMTTIETLGKNINEVDERTEVLSCCSKSLSLMTTIEILGEKNNEEDERTEVLSCCSKSVSLMTTIETLGVKNNKIEMSSTPIIINSSVENSQIQFYPNSQSVTSLSSISLFDHSTKQHTNNPLKTYDRLTLSKGDEKDKPTQNPNSRMISPSLSESMSSKSYKKSKATPGPNISTACIEDPKAASIDQGKLMNSKLSSEMSHTISDFIERRNDSINETPDLMAIGNQVYQADQSPYSLQTSSECILSNNSSESKLQRKDGFQKCSVSRSGVLGNHTHRRGSESISNGTTSVTGSCKDATFEIGETTEVGELSKQAQVSECSSKEQHPTIITRQGTKIKQKARMKRVKEWMKHQHQQQQQQQQHQQQLQHQPQNQKPQYYTDEDRHHQQQHQTIKESECCAESLNPNMINMDEHNMENPLPDRTIDLSNQQTENNPLVLKSLEMIEELKNLLVVIRQQGECPKRSTDQPRANKGEFFNPLTVSPEQTKSSSELRDTGSDVIVCEAVTVENGRVLPQRHCLRDGWTSSETSLTSNSLSCSSLDEILPSRHPMRDSGELYCHFPTREQQSDIQSHQHPGYSPRINIHEDKHLALQYKVSARVSNDGSGICETEFEKRELPLEVFETNNAPIDKNGVPVMKEKSGLDSNAIKSVLHENKYVSQASMRIPKTLDNQSQCRKELQLVGDVSAEIDAELKQISSTKESKGTELPCHGPGESCHNTEAEHSINVSDDSVITPFEYKQITVSNASGNTLTSSSDSERKSSKVLSDFNEGLDSKAYENGTRFLIGSGKHEIVDKYHGRPPYYFKAAAGCAERRFGIESNDVTSIITSDSDSLINECEGDLVNDGDTLTVRNEHDLSLVPNSMSGNVIGEAREINASIPTIHGYNGDEFRPSDPLMHSSITTCKSDSDENGRLTRMTIAKIRSELKDIKSKLSSIIDDSSTKSESCEQRMSPRERRPFSEGKQIGNTLFQDSLNCTASQENGFEHVLKNSQSGSTSNMCRQNNLSLINEKTVGESECEQNHDASQRTVNSGSGQNIKSFESELEMLKAKISSYVSSVNSSFRVNCKTRTSKAVDYSTTLNVGELEPNIPSKSYDDYDPKLGGLANSRIGHLSLNVPTYLNDDVKIGGQSPSRLSVKMTVVSDYNDTVTVTGDGTRDIEVDAGTATAIDDTESNLSEPFHTPTSYLFEPTETFNSVWSKSKTVSTCVKFSKKENAE